jgi:hypothetical protein
MASPLSIASHEHSSPEPPFSLQEPALGDDLLVITLAVDDRDVIAELRGHEDGSHRNSFALSALKIGVLALRQAQGHVDVEIVHMEGQRLIAELNRELSLGIQEIDSRIGASLKLYFDP